MYYLVDTNVFIHAISDRIATVANACKKNNNDITITETILKELEPGYYIRLEDESAVETFNSVNNLTTRGLGFNLIRLVKVEDFPGAKEELRKIRDKYYRWMKDASYLQLLISRGQLSSDDIRKQSFRNKDMGECELIAIAKVADDEYQIVSNDRGRVFLHPEQNLFDDYASEIGLSVLSSEEWLSEIDLIS